MNLSKIQRDIFLNNAKMRGEGKKKRKAPAKKTTKKKGGVVIGGKKKAPAKKATKRKLPAGARAWLDLVKQVYAQGGMSWKDALQQASKIYKKM
jgi:hypothetical protein